MDPTAGVALLMIFLIGFIVIVGRERESDHQVLSAPHPITSADPDPSRTTNARSEFERRLERQGITVLRIEAAGEYDTLATGCRYVYEGAQLVSMHTVIERSDPAQFHRLFAERRGWCGYCKGDLYDVTKIVPLSAPQGARDVGQQRLAKAFSCCQACGIVKDATEHLPDSLKDVSNFLDWLEAQENASAAPPLQEERLARLVIERERLQPRLASLDLAIARLESELHPRTDMAPYRDTPAFTEDDDSIDDPLLPRDLSRY